MQHNKLSTPLQKTKLSDVLITQLTNIEHMEDGWADPDSYAPKTELVELARQIIIDLSTEYPSLTEPHVYPVESGELSLIWEEIGITLRLDLDDAVLICYARNKKFKQHSFDHNNTAFQVLKHLKEFIC